MQKLKARDKNNLFPSYFEKKKKKLIGFHKKKTAVHKFLLSQNLHDAVQYIVTLELILFQS